MNFERNNLVNIDDDLEPVTFEAEIYRSDLNILMSTILLYSLSIIQKYQLKLMSLKTDFIFTCVDTSCWWDHLYVSYCEYIFLILH